jgi:hypothetical protein
MFQGMEPGARGRHAGMGLPIHDCRMPLWRRADAPALPPSSSWTNGPQRPQSGLPRYPHLALCPGAGRGIGIYLRHETADLSPATLRAHAMGLEPLWPTGCAVPWAGTPTGAHLRLGRRGLSVPCRVRWALQHPLGPSTGRKQCGGSGTTDNFVNSNTRAGLGGGTLRDQQRR